MKIAIFSGRFDPLHVGHILSILKIAKEYDHVIVPILNHSRRFIEAEMVKNIFTTIIDDANVTFVINNIHFGEITFKEYNEFINKYVGFKSTGIIYLSGNFEVLDHMNKIGVKNKYFERSIDEIYSGTNIREQINNGADEEFL